MSPENFKPEWFQMADADATPPQPKGRLVIKILALVTPLLVLGAGLVFAQAQESPTAVASAVAREASATTSPAVSTPAKAVIQVSKTSEDD